MIKHKPKPKTDVRIGKELYKCNRVSGIVELPVRLEQFNPIEEEEIVIKEPKKKKKED